MRRTPLTAAAVAWLVLATACTGGGDPSASPSPRDLVASPIDEPVPGPTATLPAPGPSATTSPGEVDPSASPSPGEREPTDTDRARFIASYQPGNAADLEHAAADVDGDAIEEIVFVYVRTGAGVSHVDVAWWDAEEETYAVEWGGDGGPAERIERIRIADVNADGRTELAVSQAVGSSGASVTLWRAAGGSRSFQPLIANGGCHSGSNTYGVIGAQLRQDDADPPLEVFATCDDSPLPPAAWNTDVYDWTGDAYVYARTELSDG